MPYSSSSTIATTHTVSTKSSNQSEDEPSNHSNHSNPSNTSETNMISFDSMYSNANNASRSGSNNIEFLHQNSIASNNYNLNNVIVNSTMLGCVGDNTATTSIYHSNDTISSLSTGLHEENVKMNLVQKQLDRCGATSLAHSRNFQTNTPNSNFNSASDSSNFIKSRQGSGLLDMSCMNSNTCSTVSSLANLNYNSPPRATSPTSIQVLQELLDQIQRLKNSTNSIDEDDSNSSKKVGAADFAASGSNLLKRPTSLMNKGKLFGIKNKTVYSPISNKINNSTSFSSKLKSPLSNTGILLGRGTRGRTGLMSKSAPTTPGSLPSQFQDDSPLLNEQDEDFADAEQN